LVLLRVLYTPWLDIGNNQQDFSNFNRTAGLFEHTLYTKVFALVLLALSCLGTKGVKDEKITWSKYVALGIGFVFSFEFPIAKAISGNRHISYILTIGFRLYRFADGGYG
jgi:hypothetical protein